MTTAVRQKNIPKGWQRVKLGDISEITNGKTNSQDAVADGAYPLFDRSVEIKKSNKYLFDKTAVILPGEGAEFIPRYYSGKFDLHQRAYAIFPKEDTLPSFLYQYLYAKRADFVQKSVGSTVKSLRLPIIQSIDVLLPPLSEQKKIAEILSAVDDEIQKTEEIIAATDKLKKGLMRQLFTRGIGHTKFKKTDIGDIPGEWRVLTIKESSIELIDGDRGVNYPKLKDFSPDGFCLFLSAKNVTKGGFVFNEVSFITKEKDGALRKGKLQRGDIVLTSRGTVGNVAYYDASVPYDNVRINSGMLIIRHGKQFDPMFLYQYFSGPQMREMYLSMGSGSAQPQLPIRNLEQIRIPIIPTAEQRKISEIIRAVHVKISVNKKIKERLMALKKGLTQDLLSGSKRVKI